MNLKPYLKYIYEVIAIVVGITISFMVDEWREERQEREETIATLEMIKGDLELDTLTFRQAIESFEYSVEVMESVYFGNPMILNYDSALKYMNYAAIYIKAENIKTNSYEQFKNTLSKPILYDKTIVRELSEYYDETDITEVNSLVDEALNRTWMIAIERIPNLGYGWNKYKLSDSQKIKFTTAVKEALKSPHFMNTVFGKHLTYSMLVNSYKNKVKKAVELTQLIEEELQNN